MADFVGMQPPSFRFAPVPGLERLKTRAPEEITGIVVHRIEVSQEDPSYADTPADVARFFREHPIGIKATGGDMPYPLLVEADGSLTQTVPFGYITPHAKAHNATTIGVGAMGDFRKINPTPTQRAAVIMVCAALITHLKLHPDVITGHDELQGGSADPDKICPGPGLAPADLRAEVRALVEKRGVASFDFVW